MRVVIEENYLAVERGSEIVSAAQPLIAVNRVVDDSLDKAVNRQYIARWAFAVCECRPKEVHRIRQRRPIILRRRVSKERLRRVGCRDAL